jgi:hypothetical protein
MLADVKDVGGRVWLEQLFGESVVLSDSDSSRAAVSVLLDSGRVCAIVPSNFTGRPRDLSLGGVIGRNAARHGLVSFLEALTREHGSCVVIEDDVARRSDPHLDDMSVPSAFLGDRVLHWIDLETTSGDRAASAVEESSTGYPLIAFVSKKSPAELGLVANAAAPVDFPDCLADSTMALFVSAFDAESYVILTENDLCLKIE